VEHLLYFFDYVNRKASDIVAIIDSHALGVFQSATDTALDKTAHFRSRLHFEFAGFEIGREVEIELGEPHDEIGGEVKIQLGKPLDRGYPIFIPIKWHAKDQAGLFPAMDAELEITPLSDEPPLTQIGLKGFYRPPLGPLGAVGDALLMHRVAEASVRHFVSDLAVRLRDA
jgi:hypothetical protein